MRGKATVLPAFAAGGALEGGGSDSGDERVDKVDRDDSVRVSRLVSVCGRGGAAVAGGVAGRGGVPRRCTGKGEMRRAGVGDAGGGVRTREVEAWSEAGSVGTSGGEGIGGPSPSIHCREPFGVTNGVAMNGSVSCEFPWDWACD